METIYMLKSLDNEKWYNLNTGEFQDNPRHVVFFEEAKHAEQAIAGIEGLIVEETLTGTEEEWKVLENDKVRV